MKNSPRIFEIVRIVLLVILFLTVVFPFVWMFTSSLKFEKDILDYPPKVFAQTYTLEQYKKVFTVLPIANYLKNTVIYAGSVTIISVYFDSMAGYAFARLRFKGRRVLFNIVLLTMMIPFQVTMIPLFLEIFKLGLINTYPGLIIPRMTRAFGIFMMRSFFVGLPKDLEEAARIDGENEFGIFSRIMLPLCKPALVSLGIFTLMTEWNELLYPLMMTTSSDMRTLPAGLAMFVGERVSQYGPSIAGTVIALTPLLLVYCFAQRYFVAGIAMTGMKE